MEYKSKLSNNLVLIASILVAVFTISFGIYENNREHAFRVDILHSQLQLNNYHYLEGVEDKSIRVTVIDTTGRVISDTQQKDVTVMDNHLQREEILDAIKKGTGYAIKRASETNGEKYFYSATRFGDSIVRSSVPYSAPLTSSLERDYTFLYYTCGILALIAVVLYLRHRLLHSEADKQRIIRQFTENAAHELKTPAATIQGYLETLVDNPEMPEEKRNEFVERCFTQSQRMSRLLSDMSMLSQLDASSPVFAQREGTVDAVMIINQIVDETASQYAERNVELRIYVPKQLPMHADASLIYSLFRNIFSNTFAYATGATYFEIRAIQSKDVYTFLFIDNGAGVAQEHLPHLFERFYRTDKGRSRRLGGTGLGLAIVKNIALLYGGYAIASSTIGGGLTIEIQMRHQ